ncbi:hypothetical protein Droror1_Dr00009018 [Drosera rotundifolia]
MASPAAGFLMYGCVALVMMAMVADAAVFTFTDNPLYYCQEAMTRGEQASLLTWMTCCPGLKHCAEKLNTPSCKRFDRLFGCLAFKSWCTELPGYSADYTKNMLRHCNTSYPYAISASVDCWKQYGYY